jgi:HEAT repeat protein
MKRLALLGFVLAMAMFAIAPDALAHGGQFKAPGGNVDPGQRAPEDPTPPPPPPPSGPPTTPSPSDPKPPPSSGPVTPPPSAPPPTTGPGDLGGGTRGRQAGLSYDQWVFWYAYNNAEIENLKEALYSKVGSENPMSVLGSSGSNQGSETHDVRTKIDSMLIPAMKWARDPKNARHNDVESAAYIGLAKMTRDPTDIDLLKEGLGKSMDKIMQESAALSLGLLRRAKREDQFSGSDLDRVRATLFEVIESSDYDARGRCFAAFAIGLLGDQPSGSGSNDLSATHTARLFDLLDRDYPNPEIQVAILTAIGLQSPASVTDAQRELLGDIVIKGKLGKQDAKGLVPAEAASVLGRIGTDKEVGVLRRALTSRRTDRFTESSVAIALGQLASLIDSDQRTELAKGLISSMKKIKNQQAINFALISLAYIAIEDVKAGKTDVLASAKVGEFLLKTATDGKPLEKPYGALALALVAREIGESPTVDVYGEFRHKAVTVLRDGVNSGKMTARDQAAFVIGLGIARDENSVKLLMDVLGDRKENWEKQGYAAVAIGLATPGSNADAATLIKETLVKTNEEELKIRCATALGLLRDRGALDTLLTELKNADTQSLKGQIALAIAKIGDGRSIEPMIEIMKDSKEKDLTRAIVTAALGVIGDMELIPSLNRISKDINYRAMNDSRREVVSIL